MDSLTFRKHRGEKKTISGGNIVSGSVNPINLVHQSVHKQNLSAGKTSLRATTNLALKLYQHKGISVNGRYGVLS